MTTLSYTLESTSFASAFRGLTDRVQLAAVPTGVVRRSAASSDGGGGSGSVLHLVSSKSPPAWISYVKNLAAALGPVGGNPEMFRRFFHAHREALTKSLNFYSETDEEPVQDSFFQDLAVYPMLCAPGHPDPTTPPDALGPIVYYSDKNPRHNIINLPIGEYYRAAVKVHSQAAETNQQLRLLPILTLLDFYSCIYHSLDPEKDASDRSKVAEVIVDLCNAAEAQAPGSGPAAAVTTTTTSSPSSTSSAAAFPNNLEDMFKMVTGNPMLKSLMDGVMKNLVPSAEDAPAPSPPTGTPPPPPPASSAPTGNPISDITNVVRGIVNRVTTDPTFQEATREFSNGGPITSLDVNALTRTVGAVFQNPEVQSQIEETRVSSQNAMSGLISAFAPSSSSTSSSTSTTVTELPPSV